MTSVQDLRVKNHWKNNIPFIIYLGFLLRPVIVYLIDLASVTFLVGIICFTCTVAAIVVPLFFSCNRKLNYLITISMTLLISYPLHSIIEIITKQSADFEQVVTFL